MAQQTKDKNENKNDYDGSKLFYPTYCYAKTSKLELIKDTNDTTSGNNKFEYYMTGTL